MSSGGAVSTSPNSCLDLRVMSGAEAATWEPRSGKDIALTPPSGQVTTSHLAYITSEITPIVQLP